MRDKKTRRESARKVLWDDREAILPHVLEHRDCGVFAVVQVLCYEAGWNLDSYILALVFDSAELLVEVTK
jgi:hypothetical protein